MCNTTTTTTTSHADDCRMAFGRKDPNCPRCMELLNGAPARSGWNNRNRRAESRASHARRLAMHCCKRSGCGPICTAFDV